MNTKQRYGTIAGIGLAIATGLIAIDTATVSSQPTSDNIGGNSDNPQEVYQNCPGGGRGLGRGRGRGRGPGWGRQQGMGRGRRGGPMMYDPSQVETVRGRIVSVDAANSRGGRGPGGMHAILETDNNEQIDVHMGPSWFWDQQAVQISPDDAIEVTGSRIDGAGQPTMIAGQITARGQTLNLRDDRGFPVWGGGGAVCQPQ
ncbi:MAG: hypothetical protein ACP5D7_04200 [Limnospira sp.]